MIIDAHRHLFQGEGELAFLLQDMDAHEIEHTVLLPVPTVIEFLGKRMHGNDEVFEAARQHSDRLSAAFFLDPREPSAMEDLERFADRGAVAVKMWAPIGYYPDVEAYYPLYAEIEKRRLPILYHTGFTNAPCHAGPRAATNSKYAMVIELDGLIRAFPGIDWIYAHAGNPDFMTGIHHAATHPNVYLNINGMADESGWDARFFRWYEVMQGACAPMPWQKLIWGTDNLGFDFDRFDRIFERFGMERHLASFYASNAERLYRLTRKLGTEPARPVTACKP